MFSGIVEEIGEVRAVQRGRLDIAATTVLEGLALGDSVAVNGACLTVARRGDGWFSSDVMPETLRRTNLGLLAAGAGVNLERSVTLASRIGGHIVQGHVDGTGTVAAIVPEDSALLVTIKAASALLRYLVEKGYVAVDGASLTVVDCDATAFRVSLVAYTAEHTTFGRWTVGSVVNLEVDILAKYVERLLQADPGLKRAVTAGPAVESGREQP